MRSAIEQEAVLAIGAYKVVYLITTGLGSGGAEMMLYRLLERLDKKNFQPVVVTLLAGEGPVKKKVEALGVSVYSVQIRSKFDLGAARRLYKLLKKLSPDILHTQLFAADILGRTMGRLLKVPVIITSIRNIYYGGSFRDLLIKLTEKFAHKTTFVSRAAAKRFTEAGIVPETKALVIHNGLDPDKFFTGLSQGEKNKKKEKVGIPGEGFIMLAAGSLTRQKGYDFLLKALQMISEEIPAFYLVIAGNGPLEKELKDTVEKLNLKQRVIFLGRRDDVPTLMSVADALLLSSLWEGLPGVVMEAMASGLPVIATEVGGTPELLVDGVNGYLIPPGETTAIIEAIKKVIMLDDEDRKLMGQAGRNMVMEQFHVDNMVNAYEKLYDECLKDKSQ